MIDHKCKKGTYAEVLNAYWVERIEGVTCDHPGCLHHSTHPCEGCGRIGGKNKGLNADFVFVDKHEGLIADQFELGACFDPLKLGDYRSKIHFWIYGDFKIRGTDKDLKT